MTSPDTLKDTCPHQVQCLTHDECDTRSRVMAEGEQLPMPLGAAVARHLDSQQVGEEPKSVRFSMVRQDGKWRCYVSCIVGQVASEQRFNALSPMLALTMANEWLRTKGVP